MPWLPPATRVLAGAALLAQLAGCATSTTVTPSTQDLTVRPADCHADVIAKGGAVPAGYDEVAKVETHIKRNVFFGGTVTLTDDAYRELRAKACEAGGDRVRVDDYLESAAAEMTHVHVWGDGVSTGVGAVRGGGTGLCMAERMGPCTRRLRLPGLSI